MRITEGNPHNSVLPLEIPMILLFGIGVFFAWSMTVLISDFRNRRIPNSLVIVGFVFAIFFTITHRNPFDTTLNQALFGTVLGLASFFPLFVFRVMGAADVKVFAVLGAWCGPPALFWCWVAASITALIHVAGMMYVTGTPFAALWQRRGPTVALGAHRSSPYGAFLVIPAAAWLVHQIVMGNVR